AFVTLKKFGKMPMPVEATVTFEDGSTALYYMPLRIMRGEKHFSSDESVTTLADWPWVNPTYTFEVKEDKKIKQVTVDIEYQTADMVRENNTFDVASKKKVSFE
ncbi:MAG: hypothetical protein ACI9XJ_002456, partial [Marivirga sp.]